MKEILVGTAMVVVILCGVIYLNDHVTCYNFFGIAKGCAVTK